MVINCPRCRRSLSSVSADGAPAFCMYCGQKLGGTSAHETLSHAPLNTPDASAAALPGTEHTPDDYNAGDYAPEPVPDEVGGYRLGRKLGAGGMGSVYEAEAVGGKARVAVKLLSSRLAANPSSVERFRQEGRLASQLAHPRCVFVYSADTENGRPYIVMELMPGRTLKDLVDEGGPLSPQDAITRVLDVIDGLAEAHRVGMIHRDVKPSNCFLTADDRVKVGDFGLSKSLVGVRASSLTQTGAFLGTVLFASPEQIRGEPVDYAADVYSVAATLYFLLCGEAPFQHESAAAVLARVVSEPAPRVRQKRKDVPAALEKIICRGLERDRARRWLSLGDLREALCDLLPERQHPARPRALVGAYLLDRVGLWFLTAPLEGLRLWVGEPHDPRAELFHVHWLSLAVLIAYFAVFEGRFGTTAGKWLLGLRVSLVGATGPPGIGPALARTLVLHLLLGGLWYAPAELVRLFGPATGGFLGVLVFVGCAAALLLQTRKWLGFRGLHDRASGCQVTQKPFPVRKLRLNVAKTPLDNALATADPLPDVGGFVVRGRLAVDASGEQVWLAEDRALGRRVLLWLRPWGSAAMTADPARPTRLRRLGAGSVGWAGSAYDWTAYAAPLGGPLAEAVRPGQPLPWPDARHLLDQLADEFRAAEADGSVPRKLALDHIWVEPNGRVQVLDFPLCAARYRAGTPLAVLRESASLLLEGSPRATGGALAAPLPSHARAALDSLFESEPTPADFRAELAETYAHRSEVTTAVRAAQLGVQALMLAVPLGGLFVLAFVTAAALTFLAGLEAKQARHTAAVLAAPAERAKLADAADRELGEALNSPRMGARVADLVARSEAEYAARRAALPGPQRRIVEGLENPNLTATRRADPSRGDRAVVLWAGAPPGTPAGRMSSPWGDPGPPVIAAFVTIALGLVATAAVLRGGASLLVTGVAVVRTDGRPASRWQCAARAALVWLPPVGLLLGSAALQVYAPAQSVAASGLWLAAAALMPVYALVALRYPARPPHDRLTGTHLVPG